jgi:hypothetical protein
MEHALTGNEFDGKQVTLILLAAVRSYRVYLVRVVFRPDISAPRRVPAPARIHDDDVASLGSALTLNSEKAPVQVKDEVVSRIGMWPGNDDAELHRLRGDYRFGKRALLIG